MNPSPRCAIRICHNRSVCPGAEDGPAYVVLTCGIINLTVGLITDGRFSGFNRGPIVGHVSPEAMEGGVIAIIEDGDMIEMDIPGRKLNVELSEDEIAQRLKHWRPPEPKTKTGFLALYAQLTLPAEQGAAMQKWS